MSNCIVQRGSDNQIIKVLDNTGNESQLFKQIAAHPLVDSTEDALSIYKNKYSNKLSNAEIKKFKADDIYKKSSELSKIGTYEEYNKYLNSIFPDSINDTVFYHNTNNEETKNKGFIQDYSGDLHALSKAVKSNKPIYFTSSTEFFNNRTFQIPAILNVKKTAKIGIDIHSLNEDKLKYYKEKGFDSLSTRGIKDEVAGKGITPEYNVGIDAIDRYSNTKEEADKLLKNYNEENVSKEDLEFVVFDTNQIHILDSQKDIQDFKNFKNAGGVIENNINFTHSVDGKQYSSFKDALENASESQKIELGFSINGEFTPIQTFTKNTEKSTENGFVQAGIVEGLIAEERIKIGDEYLLQSQGESQLKKNVSLDLLANDAMTNLGSKGIEISGTTFKLNKDLGKTLIENKNGEIVKIDSSKLDEMTLDELKNSFEDGETIFAEREYKKNVPIYRENELPSTIPTLKSEEEIKMNTFNLLKKMGVLVISITNYAEKYQTRNSAPISAQALADIANNVIAFQAGQDTLENLREETIHFIIEALPQARLENVLRNIHNSEEYKQFAQTYREIYSKEYDEEDVETAVRKEVLGKIALNAVMQNQAVSETTQNFYDSAINFIRQFFQDIAAYFKPSHITELESILDDIQNTLDSGDIHGLELDNLTDNKFRFYSLVDKSTNASKLAQSTRKLAYILNEENNNLERNQQGSKLNREKLKTVQKELDNTLELHSVATTVSVCDTQVNRLNAAIKDSEDKNKLYDLSQEEVLIFKNLTTETTDTLGEIKALIDSDPIMNQVNAWNTLSKEITRVQNKITELKAKRSVTEAKALERQVDALTIDRGLPQSTKEAMMRWQVQAEADVSWLGATFGTLNNSPQSLLSLLAVCKTGMMSEGSRMNHNQMKAFQKIIHDNGYDEKIISTFVKDGYFISERDLVKYYKKLDANFISEYKKVITNTTLKDDEILAKRHNGTLGWTDEQKDTINEATKILNDLESERRMSSDYYNELEKKYKDLDISKDTQKVLQGLNADKRKITERARDKNGKLDLSLLSGQDREQLLTLNLNRKQMKSYIDETGALKNGLDFTINSEGKVEIVPIKPLDQLSPASRLALDLNKLDSSYEKIGEKEKLEIPQSFIDTILSKEDRSAQVQALELNTQLGFSQEFWDGLGVSKGLLDEIEDEKLVSAIKELVFKRSNILKLYSKTLNPSEIDVENIPELSRQTIKDIEEKLGELYSQARESVSSSERVESLIQGVSGVNEAWNKKIKDLDLIAVSYILDLAKLHMTDTNKKTVQRAEDAVDSFIKGKRSSLPKSVMRSLEKMGLEKEDLMKSDIRDNFLKTFAEDRLLSYYRRYTPASYNDFQNDLNSNKPVSEILDNLKNNKYEFVEIRPNYSYQDEDISNVNPKYIVSAGYGVNQPSADKYMNGEFYNLFGNVTRDSEGNYLSSEKNEKLFNVYKATMKFRKDQIMAMDGDASYNIYMSPQIRKQGIERWMGGLKSLSGQSIKDALENLRTYTEDDQIKGDTRLGSANKSIPKQFFNRLENQTDLTTDIFHGLAMTNAASNLYKSRVKYFGDAMSIIDKASTVGTPDGKIGTATNRYKAIESAIDNDFFGIKQASTATIDVPFIGKTDAAKLVNSLGSFLRFKGLGFNAVIASTGYLTAKSSTIVERIVGQYINKDSYNRGKSIYHKELGSAMSEINHVRTTSRLNSIGQFFGAYELENTFHGSKFSAFPRLLSKSAMLMYQGINHPLYGKGMLMTLNDFRIVDGKLVKFTDFQRNERMKNIKATNSEIQAKWTNENTVIYDFLDVSDAGEVSFNKEELKKLLKDNKGEEYSDSALDDEINRFTNDIRIQVKNINVKIDNQLSHEDRVAAQRNFWLNFLLMFKSFMISSAEARFKGHKFNEQSRQYEEGSYIGIYRMVLDISKEWQKNGNNFIEAFKNQYNGNFTEQEARIEELEKIQDRTFEQEKELQSLKEEVVKGIENSELRKANLKRISVDLLFINTLMLISMLLRSLSDDDKKRENWTLQMANLLTYRLVGEVHSASLGMPLQYWQSVKQPLQAFQSIIDARKVLDASQYGEGKILSTLGRVMPISNSINQLADPGRAFQNKVFYQEQQDSMFSTVPIYMLLNKDKN